MNRGRSSLFRWSVLALAAAAGPTCARDRPSANIPTTPATAACEAYTDDLRTFSVCVTRLATSQLDPALATPLCESLPSEGAQDCRRAWVEHRLNEPTRPPIEQMLAMCGPLPDCGFRVLDQYPNPDAAVQIKLCGEHAGPYDGDCAGHTLQRWADTNPPAEEIARLWVPMSAWPDRFGTAVGMVLYCHGARLDGSAAEADAVGCPKDSSARSSCLGTLRAAQRDNTPCRAAKP